MPAGPFVESVAAFTLLKESIIRLRRVSNIAIL
jgi:hypothetical protein